MSKVPKGAMAQAGKRAAGQGHSGGPGGRPGRAPVRSDPSKVRTSGQHGDPQGSGRRGEGLLPPDAELVRRSAAGEAGAFEPLVRRYSDVIVRFAHHMLGDFQAAEDVAQESLLKAYSHIGRLEDPEKFPTWLYSITRHHCLDWIRSRHPSVSVEMLEADGVEVAEPGDGSPSERMAAGELHERVLGELRALRPDYREILLMKHVYELSYKEISEAVGLSVSAVGEKLSRVRQMLRERLRRRSSSP